MHRSYPGAGPSSGRAEAAFYPLSFYPASAWRHSQGLFPRLQSLLQVQPALLPPNRDTLFPVPLTNHRTRGALDEVPHQLPTCRAFRLGEVTNNGMARTGARLEGHGARGVYSESGTTDSTPARLAPLLCHFSAPRRGRAPAGAGRFGGEKEGQGRATALWGGRPGPWEGTVCSACSHPSCHRSPATGGRAPGR